MNLSVVIPAYNESSNIKITLAELLSTIERTPDIDKVQIIVVDDHSSDETFDIVAQVNDPRISCLRLSRRSGSYTALRAGLKEADGDAVLCISADGQDDPSCIRAMLKKWRNGARIVWALRKSRKDEPWHIKKPAEMFYKVLGWTGGHSDSPVDLSRADFCLLDRIVVDAINTCDERNTSIFGLIIWAGFTHDFVEYERRKRMFGRSKWNFQSRMNYAKDWIIAFSGLPLKLMSVMGILVAILGFLYAVYIIIDVVFFSKPVEGWASTIVTVLFLGGIQMIMLGIIGEYLWRNIEESRKRPLCFIEKKTENRDN